MEIPDGFLLWRLFLKIMCLQENLVADFQEQAILPQPDEGEAEAFLLPDFLFQNILCSEGIQVLFYLADDTA